MAQRKGHGGLCSGTVGLWLRCEAVPPVASLFKYSLAKCGAIIIHLLEVFWWVKFHGKTCQCRTLQSC